MRFILVLGLLAGLASADLVLIDQPSGEFLEHGQYLVSARLQAEGGILAGACVGFFGRVNIGISYGGMHLLGSAAPAWYPEVGITARARLLTEAGIAPTVLAGFDSQGYGPYLVDRYENRARGLFLLAAKKILYPLGSTAAALGVNYTFWGNRGLDLFAGVEQGMFQGLALLADYTPALGDTLDRNRGDLNLGLRWTFMDAVSVQASLRDLLGNRARGVDRILTISYKEWF